MFSIFSSNKKKKVMFIDDDDNILKMYEQVFGVSDTFEVITVNNKTQFLKHVKSVDAVVSDFHMKEVTEMNFSDVLDICDLNKKPLLLITGDIYPYYDYQLSKPVSAKSIKLNVEKMIERGYIPSKKKPPKKMAA